VISVKREKPKPQERRKSLPMKRNMSLCFVLSLVLASCNKTQPEPQPQIHTVRYEVSGYGVGYHESVSLTYTNESGGSEQKDFDGKSPWVLEMMKPTGATLYISAQNKQDTDPVGVKIYVDGALLQEASSTAEYGIATASGSIQ
jgi:hypothetical protein